MAVSRGLVGGDEEVWCSVDAPASSALGVLVSWFAGFSPFSLGGVPGESLASTLSVPAAAARSRRFLIGGALLWSSVFTLRGWALREKSLASGSRAGDGGGYVAPFLEASSWRVHSVCRLKLLRRRLGGCRGSGPEQMVFARRGGGLGNHGGQQLHGAGLLLGLDWATILCR